MRLWGGGVVEGFFLNLFFLDGLALLGSFNDTGAHGVGRY